MRRPSPTRGGGAWRKVSTREPGSGGGGEAFLTRDEMDKVDQIDQIKRRLNACSEPPIFDGKVCNCMSPASILWILNFVCFLVHAGMAVVVFREGANVGELVDFQTVSVRNQFNRSRVNWYTPALSEDAPVLGLDLLCGTFALLSAFAHLLIVCFSRFSINKAHERFNLKYYYFGLHSCLVFWRWCEYFLSAPVMVVAMLLICGVQEINTLVLCFFGQATTILFGCVLAPSTHPTAVGNPLAPAACGSWGTELYARPDYESEKGWEIESLWSRLVPFLAGFVPYTATWVIFIVTFYKNVASAKDLNDVAPPNFVYVIILSQVVLFSMFALPLPIYQKRHPRHYWETGAPAPLDRRTRVCRTVVSVNATPPCTELWYSVLSLASKVILNGLILSNVLLASRIDLDLLVSS